MPGNTVTFENVSEVLDEDVNNGSAYIGQEYEDYKVKVLVFGPPETGTEDPA